MEITKMDLYPELKKKKQLWITLNLLTTWIAGSLSYKNVTYKHFISKPISAIFVTGGKKGTKITLPSEGDIKGNANK